MGDPGSVVGGFLGDLFAKVFLAPFRWIRRRVASWRLDEGQRQARLRDAYTELSSALITYCERKSIGMAYPQNTVGRIGKAAGALKMDCPSLTPTIDSLTQAIRGNYSFDIATANKRYLNPINDGVQECLRKKQ